MQNYCSSTHTRNTAEDATEHHRQVWTEKQQHREGNMLNSSQDSTPRQEGHHIQGFAKGRDYNSDEPHKLLFLRRFEADHA